LGTTHPSSFSELPWVVEGYACDPDTSQVNGVLAGERVSSTLLWWVAYPARQKPGVVSDHLSLEGLRLSGGKPTWGKAELKRH
jgi:hypothetical protein